MTLLPCLCRRGIGFDTKLGEKVLVAFKLFLDLISVSIKNKRKKGIAEDHV